MHDGPGGLLEYHDAELDRIAGKTDWNKRDKCNFTAWIKPKAAENKFKCPCHGSGYYISGINFEGPAPRPMDRAHVELDPTGQIVVDTSRLYQQPKGQTTHFDDPGAADEERMSQRIADQEAKIEALKKQRGGL